MTTTSDKSALMLIWAFMCVLWPVLCRGDKPVETGLNWLTNLPKHRLKRLLKMQNKYTGYDARWANLLAIQSISHVSVCVRVACRGKPTALHWFGPVRTGRTGHTTRAYSSLSQSSSISLCRSPSRSLACSLFFIFYFFEWWMDLFRYTCTDFMNVYFLHQFYSINH